MIAKKMENGNLKNQIDCFLTQSRKERKEKQIIVSHPTKNRQYSPKVVLDNPQLVASVFALQRHFAVVLFAIRDCSPWRYLKNNKGIDTKYDV
jgi:hypothetical protein